MSILKREVYYDNTNGIARFWDWANVTTTLGMMAEPFVPGSPNPANTDVENFDPTDPIARIDSIRALSRDVSLRELSGGSDPVNGGDLRPRTGP